MKRDQTFGAALRALRHDVGITQAAMASHLKMCSHYVRDVEAGHRRPLKPPHIHTLCTAVGRPDRIEALRIASARGRGALDLSVDDDATLRLMVRLDERRTTGALKTVAVQRLLDLLEEVTTS